jgi:hypothetical protein
VLRDQIRLDAARNIAEALSVVRQLAPPQGAPEAAQPGPMPAPASPLPQPPGARPQAALGMAQGPQPQQRPAMSPLQAVPSFRSPPLQAALQGAEGMKGHPAMTQPVGFAKGGLVVRRD